VEQQLLDDFQNRYQPIDRSDNADKAAYSFVIGKFQQWLIPIAHLEKSGEPMLSHELLSDFINYLTRHYSEETVRIARKVMNVFARWALDQGLLSPVTSVKVHINVQSKRPDFKEPAINGKTVYKGC